MFEKNHNSDAVRDGKRGFSLIELLIVVAIILIIAAIAIPNLLRARMAANQAAGVSNIRTITSAAIVYSSTYSDGYPPDLVTLGGAGVANCNGAILLDDTLTTPPFHKSGYIIRLSAARAHRFRISRLSAPLLVSTNISRRQSRSSSVKPDRPAIAAISPVKFISIRSETNRAAWQLVSRFRTSSSSKFPRFLISARILAARSILLISLHDASQIYCARGCRDSRSVPESQALRGRKSCRSRPRIAIRPRSHPKGCVLRALFGWQRLRSIRIRNRYFSRPGRMRWDYESPEQKLFSVDGTNVWFYVPADRTASRAKMKESSDWRTPIALLAGKADLSRLCGAIEIVDPSSASADPKEVRPSGPGNIILRCTPRKVSSDGEDANVLRDVLLETDPESHLVRVIIHEAGNVETEFRFGNWQENIPIDEAQFHFQPPPGVTIVDEATLANAIH